jgi:hypothetical protein
MPASATFFIWPELATVSQKGQTVDQLVAGGDCFSPLAKPIGLKADLQLLSAGGPSERWAAIIGAKGTEEIFTSEPRRNERRFRENLLRPPLFPAREPLLGEMGGDRKSM